MSTFKILSVEIVEGKTLNSKWRSSMQKIKTDCGEFIDNMPGKQFGYHKKASPGFDWESKIGQTVGANIIKYKGQSWLNSKEDIITQLENMGIE